MPASARRRARSRTARPASAPPSRICCSQRSATTTSARTMARGRSGATIPACPRLLDDSDAPARAAFFRYGVRTVVVTLADPAGPEAVTVYVPATQVSPRQTHPASLVV